MKRDLILLRKCGYCYSWTWLWRLVEMCQSNRIHVQLDSERFIITRVLMQACAGLVLY